MNQSSKLLLKKRKLVLKKKNFSISLSTLISLPLNYFLIKNGPLKIYRTYSTIQLNGRSSENWPISVGEIVKKGEIEEKNNLFKPIIEYKYSIGERHFTGKTLFFSLPEYTKNNEKLKEILKKYEHKNQIFVRFNPKNPSESILEPGNHFENENLSLLIKHQIFWIITIISINLLIFIFITNKIELSKKQKKKENKELLEYKKYERKRMFENIFLRKYDPAIPPPPTSNPPEKPKN
eukprot:gene529-8041_t